MTKSELLGKFQAEATDFMELADSFSEQAFATQPHAEKWSAAQNLKHLVQVHASIAGGLKDPSVLAQFGAADDDPPRSFEAIRDMYITGLAKAKAAGRFPYKHLDTPESKAELMSSFTNLNQKIVERANVLTDAEFDKFQMPHPVLGLMKVREMLSFITYHVRHHNEIVSRIVV